MKDRRIDRFVILPFSVGCVSQSSIAVVETRLKKAQGYSNDHDQGPTEHTILDEKAKGGSLIATGLQRIVKSFKSFSSQLFQVYGEEDEEETEMEIGLPTDVQHVGHIGWDGLANNNVTKKWINDGGTGVRGMTGGTCERDILSLSSSLSSSLSMRQLELAMAGVTSANHGPFYGLA